MKMVTINKIKVRVFEEDDLIQKLGLAKEKAELVLEYQRKFPELLQENNGDFIIDAENLWNQLNKPQGEYAKWFKRKIKPLFLENVDFTRYDKLVGTIKNGNGKKVERHILNVEMAKQISLMSGSDKNSSKDVRDTGRFVRDYFITMEDALRDYETWTSIREPEKDGWNIMRQYIKEWCIRNNYDETLNKFYIREANMININLTGKSANEIKTYIGFKDTITRDHLDSETNKAISELQNINISLLLADLDFKTRSSIIKTTCENKYSDLYINNIKEVS